MLRNLRLSFKGLYNYRLRIKLQRWRKEFTAQLQKIL